MRWPRGKYNGQRIVGFQIEFRLDVLHWAFRRVSRFDYSFIIGPFQIRFGAVYEPYNYGKVLK